MRPRLSKYAHGFTLIEVIVAFVIAALALTAFYEAFSLGFRASEAAEAALKRQIVAENRLAELDILIPLAPGRSTGREAGIAWEVTIRPADGFSPRLEGTLGVRPMMVRVDVTDGKGRLTLKTLRLAQQGGGNARR